MNKITLYNLSVRIETQDVVLVEHLDRFISRHYTIRQKSMGPKQIEEKKPFVSCANDGRFTVYMHKYQYAHFLDYAVKNNFEVSFDKKEVKKDYEVELVDYKLKPEWKPRDYQEPIIDFIVNDPNGSKLVPIQTGKGKTSIALFSVARLGVRLAIVILPVYIDKWIHDIQNMYDISPDEIMVIKGSKAVAGLIQMAKDGELDAKVIIFSSRTLQDFISYYENETYIFKEEYGIEPIDLIPLIKAGILLIDETHQHFHAIYKILIHSNVKLQIGLSATLMSEDYTVRRLHTIVYPKKNVYEGLEYDRYIDVYPIAYNINPDHMKFIRTSLPRQKIYSHIAFENSIMKHQFLLDNYIKLIDEVAQDYFIEDYKKGDKLLIFVSRVNMATKVTEHFRKYYGNYVVNRYCEDDDYEIIDKSDIIVSTIISAGTAIDIKGLRVVIQTICISSIVTNLQSLGRLRKLPDRDVKFCYLYSPAIKKHLIYHNKRKDIFLPRVRNICERRATTSV